MSHPLYNPRGGSFSGGQRPMMSGQFGLGTQSSLDLGASRMGPTPGTMPGPRGGMMSPMVSQQMGFPLTQRPSQMSQDLDASIDRNIQGAREEVRLLAQMIQQQQQPKQPDPRLRKETREEVLSTGGGFQGSRGPGRSDEPLVEWSSYQTPSKLFAAPNMGQASNTSQLFPATGFASSSGLGSGGLSSQAPPEHHPGRYTSESASSILASFGLSNEDLELLSHYPDDQLTPDNLPFILRDIRIRKAKRSVPDMRPSSDLLGSDPRQSKVIDYGHSSKFGISEENPDGYKRDHLMKESPTYGREVSRSPFGGADISKRPPPSQPVLTPGPSQSIQKPPAMDLRTAVPSADLKSSKALPGRHAVPQPIHPPVSRPAPPSSHAVGSLGTISDVPASTKPIWPHVFPPPLSNPLNTKRLPTPTLMNDYSAATPRIFPHTCSLCNIECVLIKDWIEHQNTNQHIESCRRLRKQYPDWNVETVTVTRNEPKLEPRSPKRRTRSHSYSRTPSPRRHHGSSGRRLRSRSRSRSPRKHRRTRSHSRSRSPRRSSRASPPQYRRRSRTPPRQRSRSPGYGRRSPVRSGRRVSPRRISPRRISPRRMSPRRVGPPRHQRSSSERLAMKLLESSAELSSITDSNALKAMVQSLAPALLAELAKKKSNSSSSSMTGSSSRKSSFPPSSKKNEASISSGSSTPKTTSSSKTVKPKKKASPGTACLLKITGVPFGTTHTELEEAVKPFGKLHTAVLLKAIGEASVCMASEEDAKALVNCKDLKLHGKVVQVSMEKAIQEDLKETPPAVKKPTVKKKLASVIKLPLAGKAKPQPVKAKPSQPSKVKPTAKSTEATPVLKKVVKREIPWRKNVLEISGLPVGVTEDDLTKLAQPHGFNTVPVIAITQNKAYLEMPDKKAAEAMVNAYSETPVKVQETEISIKMMTQPIDLKYTESVFRVLMGMEKSPEFVTLPERLLTVNNVPKGSTAITEVQELIKRFGAYKQSLPLNNRIIFEMETAAIARTLHSRFLKFPCIVQNNSLSFTLAKVPKSIDEVKKKPVPKRPGAGAKSDEMRKKGPAAGAKPAVALAKAKMAKGQTPGAAAAKAANSNVNAKPKESVMTPKAAPPGETVTGNALVVDTSARSTTAPAPANAVSITATSGDSEGPVSRDAPTETGAKMKDCDTTPGVGDEMKTAATTEAEAADSCAEDGAKMETAASTDAAFSEAEAKMDPQDNNSTEAGAQKDSLNDAQNETQMDSKVALEVDSAPATSELTKIALDNKGGLNSENGPDTALRLSTENLSAEQGKNNEVQEGQAKDTVVPASSVRNESTATVASSGELMETQIAPVKETTKGAEVKQGDVIVTEPLKILADPPKVDDQTLDFPPITQEILKALEAAVHQCRMQSSLRSAEDQARQEQGSTEKTLNKHKAPGPKRLAATNSKTFQKSNASTPKSVKGKKLATAGVKGHSGISSSPDRESFSRHRSRAGSEEEQVPSTPRGGSSSSSSTTSQRSKRESSPVSMRSKERKSHRSSGTTRSRSDSRRKEEKKVEEMEEMSDFPFNLDEFVTVDEVGDEVAEESVVQEPSPKRKRHQDSKKTTTVSSTPKSQKPLPPTPKAKQVKKPTVRKTRSVAAAEAVVQEAKDDAAEIKVVERADCKPISKVGEIQKKEEKEPQKTSPEAAITAQSNQITLEETPSCGKEKTSCGAGEPTAVPPAGQGGCSATRMLTAEAPSLHVDCADSRLSDQSSSSKSEPHPLPAHPEPPHPAAEDRPLELAGKTKRVVMDKAAQRPPDPNNLVSLDEVSEEEEDYPDDEAEEELLRRQAGEDPEALVTVDEVGDDEEHLEKDLQGLVTLDEIVGEDEDEGNPDEELGDIFNPETLVTLDEAKGDDEDEVGEAKNPSPDVVHSALVEGARGSLSHDEEVQDLEVLRRMNFVTVDEVGEEEEEQSNEKEKKQQEETPTSRGRRPKKSTRQTPVRKSLRGKRGLGKAPKEPEEAVEEQATPAPPVPVDTCPGTEPSGLGSELHSDKAEVATGLPGPDVPTSGQEEDVGIQDHGSESSRSSDCKGEAITEKRRTIKEGSKQRRVASEKQELEAKRAHSHLPMDQDFTLPPFNPDSPVGVDFVVPKTGYFCKLCSLFYGSEDTAKRSHCSSLRHYQNMEKYYKKLKSQQRDGNCS